MLTKRRMSHVELQDCPQHTFVQREFLNQICDDCLMRELDIEPLSLDSSEPPAPVTDHSECLIWDSEVTVEVDSMHFELLPVGRKQVGNIRPAEFEEDDKRILESHVEIKIEMDGSSISGGDTHSPLFPDSATSSGSFSPDTSAPNGHAMERFQLSSPTYRNKRYGFALPKGVTYELDDADDEFDDYPEVYDLGSSPLFRGRSLTRKNSSNFQICSDESDVSGKGKARSRLKSFKSISSTLRSKSKPTYEDTRILGSPQSIHSAASTRPRTLFHSLRRQKSSPFLVQSLEANQADSKHCKKTYNNLESVPSRTTGLKSWARAILLDSKWDKHFPPVESRSSAPSPTKSQPENKTSRHEKLRILESPSETAFETESMISVVDRDEKSRAEVGLPQLMQLKSPSTAEHIASTDDHHESNNQDTHEDKPAQENESEQASMPAAPGEVAVPTNPSEVEWDEKPQNTPTTHPSEMPDAEGQPVATLVPTAQPFQLPEEGTTQFPAVTVSGGGAEHTPEKVANRQPVASEVQSPKSDAMALREQKRILTPRSAYFQNIAASNETRPHPPRKSSLRRVAPPSSRPAAVTKYSFPLSPRVDVEKWAALLGNSEPSRHGESGHTGQMGSDSRD